LFDNERYLNSVLTKYPGNILFYLKDTDYDGRSLTKELVELYGGDVTVDEYSDEVLTSVEFEKELQGLM